MSTWSSLPTELRLHILGFVVPGRNRPIQATSTLGFGRPRQQCNVVLLVPPDALRKLHKENPAGSRGQFWRPLQELLVSKGFAVDTWSVFRTSLVIVDTWLSFLENRNAALFAPVQRMSFRYPYLDQTWFRHQLPAMDGPHGVAMWADELVHGWMLSLEEMSTKHMPQAAVLELETRHPCEIKYGVTLSALEQRGVYLVMVRAKRRIACAVVDMLENSEMHSEKSLAFTDSDCVDHEALMMRFESFTAT